jgi:vacuolar iron transporter family protein
MPVRNKEQHRTGRIGWLRATVLGANDGILSTSSLQLGVAAAHATHSNELVAGAAGLVAGAMSMAAGEYVSVQSQADTDFHLRARYNMETVLIDGGGLEILSLARLARSQDERVTMLLDPNLRHLREVRLCR